MMAVDRADWSGKRVCVTGGTGLLGFQLVRALLDRGARVRVLALPPLPQHPIHALDGVELITGDIRDRELVRAAVSGSEVVFHTAGAVAAWGPALKVMRAVHVEGTRNVLDTAEPAARVVLTSSVVTIGASRTGASLTEESRFTLDRLKVDYIHAKRAAEQLALERAAGQDVVVTNPGYMVGPEDYERSVMGRFCTRYWRGLVPLAPPGGFNFVDARDVALGHLLAAQHGKAGRRYILGGEDRRFPEFMALLAAVGGLNPRAFPVVPGAIQTALAALAECRAWATHEPPYPALQHTRLNRFHWFYRSDRAERELGYRARPLVVSLRETYAWYAGMWDFRVRGVSSRWWLRPARPPAAPRRAGGADRNATQSAARA